MNVELCEANSGRSKKMGYFRENKVGGGGGGNPDPPSPSPGSATVPSLPGWDPQVTQGIPRKVFPSILFVKKNLAKYSVTTSFPF